MSIRYEAGNTLAHRLDPRTKLGVQMAFAVAAFLNTTPRGLAILTGLTALPLLGARLSPRAAFADVRILLPFLLAGPILSGLTVSPLGFSVARARLPALAAYRTLLLLFVAAAYVKTTPARDSQAAIQRLVPGRVGRLLGLGVGFVFRFFPVVRRDVTTLREASRARLGDERSIPARMQLLTIRGVARALRRADTLSLAARARCLSWNPTLPRLTFSRLDLIGGGVAAGLLLFAIL